MTSFFTPIALRKAKIVYNFGLSECSRVKGIYFKSAFIAKKKKKKKTSIFAKKGGLPLILLKENWLLYGISFLFFRNDSH